MYYTYTIMYLYCTISQHDTDDAECSDSLRDNDYVTAVDDSILILQLERTWDWSVHLCDLSVVLYVQFQVIGIVL